MHRRAIGFVLVATIMLLGPISIKAEPVQQQGHRSAGPAEEPGDRRVGEVGVPGQHPHREAPRRVGATPAGDAPQIGFGGSRQPAHPGQHRRRARQRKIAGGVARAAPPAAGVEQARLEVHLLGPRMPFPLEIHHQVSQPSGSSRVIDDDATRHPVGRSIQSHVGPVTGPALLVRTLHEVRADRLEVDVGHYVLQHPLVADQLRAIPPSKHRPIPSRTPITRLRESTGEPLHATREVAVHAPDQQVEMIGQQRPRMHLPPEQPDHTGELVQERNAVGVLEEDPCLSGPTVDDVVPRARKVHSCRACHPAGDRVVNIPGRQEKR